VTVANYSGVRVGGVETIDISAHAAGQSDLQVRFRYHDASRDFWWGVDDVFVLGVHHECENSGIFADGFETGDTSRWAGP